jgi:hypothetical protein
MSEFINPATLVVVLSIAAITILWIVAPMLNRSGKRAGDVVAQRENLTAHYERLLQNIRDLDEDFHIGKLTETAYQQERTALVDRAITVLRALDALEPLASTAGVGTSEVNVDRQIEQAVAAYRRSLRTS